MTDGEPLRRFNEELFYPHPINLLFKLTTPQPSLKEIMKEIRVLRGKIDKVENILEERLVGEAKPDKYEKRTIANFERRRRAGKLEFVLSPS